MIIPQVKFPEMVFGFVAPIGTDLKPVVASFRHRFEKRGYEVVEIKVTDTFTVMKEFYEPEIPLVPTPEHDRYGTYIAYGNQLRQQFNDDSLLAATTITQIIAARKRLMGDEKTRYEKRVYLLYQFKRKEEIDLLRSVYGRLFFQVSLYSRRGARVEFLSRKFASSADASVAAKYRQYAEKYIEDDENESGVEHGQRVSKIFHDADFIVSLDSPTPVRDQVRRFCDLIFGNNNISPTRQEYGMFLAKAAALRTLDLSRQVGAAIFSKSGEVISLGSNEVPKAGGGTYWCDDPHDDREYKRGFDSNDQRKKEILSELVKAIVPDADPDVILRNPKVQDSQFMDALEYGRIVHAEMSAISDAARIGLSTKDSTLYCTTFPCHMCAKHIISTGVSSVVFLEPYPKSLASNLHSDAIQIEQADRGRFQEYPSVGFNHFFGVSPRRYREIFERGKRKNGSGMFVEYSDGSAAPFINIKFPFYTRLEEWVLEFLSTSSPIPFPLQSLIEQEQSVQAQNSRNKGT